MTKFHINSKGVPAPCHAIKGNCPFGGADSHYKNIEDAQAEANRRNEAEHGILPSRTSYTRYIEQDLKGNSKSILKLISNDVSAELKSGEIINGILTQESNVNQLSIMPYGGLSKNNVVEIDTKEIKHIDKLSDRKSGWSSDVEYHKNLRANGEPRPEFKLSVNQMRDMSHKFAKISYDGKDFDGKIIDFYSDGVNNSALIIENNEGVVKEVKNYRLVSLEITGNDERAHENYLINDEIIDNIEKKYKEDKQYITVSPEDVFDESFEEQYQPINKVDEYFEARIKVHMGEQADLESYENINWYREIEGNKSFYKEEKISWDKGSNASIDKVWTDNSEAKFSESFEMADNAFVYFGERQDLIDDTFKEVQDVDWTPYHSSQLEGEVAALRRIQRERVVSL